SRRWPVRAAPISAMSGWTCSRPTCWCGRSWRRGSSRTTRSTSALAVVREGRVVVLDELVGGALAWGTVLSLPFAIDDLVPQLAAAIDGVPATEVTA
ncbi:MAG: hypothetical protein ACRD0K_30795, partial [Egibacteraceae bacterium]